MWHDFEEVQIANENKTTRMMFLNIFLIWTQWGRYSRSGCEVAEVSGGTIWDETEVNTRGVVPVSTG